MSPVIERLAELRSHLDHLASLAPRVPDAEALRTDMSLRNDVLFSLFMASQLVIDIAAELSARSGRRFADYTEAIRNLALDPRFPVELVRRLATIPGFRNVIVHEYIVLDLDLTVAALHDLEALERFVSLVATAEAARLAE
jgi:uncharacterized protein YutE (UPF0331/DUF86 family)